MTNSLKAKRKAGIHYIQNKHREWFACIIAKNGKETWRTTDTYKRRAGAVKAAKSADDFFITFASQPVFIHKF